ncbi:MAG: hypothetical protein AB201_01860 [Parcubacteria bacterium C7867-006]|nr:MAG: hypothetical protein AB201_01860 [Parcubacteria bacterium C7867-006]
MRIARSLALVLLVFLSATNAFAQKGEYAVPKDAQLEQYPVLEANKPLTVVQIADMHLHPIRLDKPTVVQNHFRGLHGKEGRFVVETLPKGTLVLVDENNNLRYKEDCGNRLVEFDNQALVRGIISSDKLSEPVVVHDGDTLIVSPDSTKVIPAKPMMSLWDTVASTVRRGVEWLTPFAHFIGWLLLAILLFGIIWAVIMAGLEDRDRRRYNRNQMVGDQTHPSHPAATVPPPAPNAPAATTPAAAPANTERAFITHSAGSGSNPHLLRWGGLDFHSLEVAPDGVHSLRYHPRTSK